MLPTIAISELQKNLSKTIKNLSGVMYIFSNNKPAGALINTQFMQYLEENGILEEYEDHLLYQAAKPNLDNVHKKISEKDNSEMMTFDELCQSI